MNGFRRTFMGQVPLILGPSSWGAGMIPMNYAPANPCPPDSFIDENGNCRPRSTMGQNVLKYFDVPLGAFPVPWNMGCEPGEERAADGVCKPKHRMGEEFEVPLGAFPVPWNMPCQPGETRDQDGLCKTNHQMGVIPAMAFGTVFEYKEDDPISYYDVRLAGSRRRLGQEKPTCEQTAEGGYRCSDGTYLPPGCAAGSSQTVKAAPPSSGFPYVAAGLVAAGVATGVALLAGRRMGATALETSYPEIAAKLSDYASRINSERAADAYNFQQYITASKKRLSLVDAQKSAEAALNEQEKLWNATHMNQDKYVAAQQAVDRISADLGQAAQDRDTYRAAIDMNQSNIQAYYANANALIASLPGEFQAEAKALIEACFKSPVMQGGMRTNRRMSGRSVNLGQAGQATTLTPTPPAPTPLVDLSKFALRNRAVESPVYSYAVASTECREIPPYPSKPPPPKPPPPPPHGLPTELRTGLEGIKAAPLMRGRF